MRLRPYEQVDDVPFTWRVDDLLARKGRPLHVGRNDVELDEYDYGSVVYRFQANGRLEEVTQRAPVLHLPAVAVPFAALEGFLRHHDAGLFERAGFLVSPAFGLAYAPDSSNWVTALARHCIPTWRDLQPGPSTGAERE